MSPEEITTRFEAAIDRRGSDDRFIDRNEEREILQIALQLGMPDGVARAALAKVCGDRGYVQETGLVAAIRAKVDATPEVDRTAFTRIATETAAAARGTRTDRQVRALVLQVLEDSATARVSTGWFRDWYAAAKREAGVG